MWRCRGLNIPAADEPRRATWQHSQVGAWHCHAGVCMPQCKAAFQSPHQDTRYTRSAFTNHQHCLLLKCFNDLEEKTMVQCQKKKKKKSKGGFWHWPDCNCTGGYRRFLLFKTLNRSNYLHFWLYIFTIDFWAMYAACTHIMRLCHLFHHVLQGEENKQMRIIFFFC